MAKLNLMDIYFFTVAIMALWFLFLSINVIRNRRQVRVLYGSGDNLRFNSVIRAHANFAEYVPLNLILLYAVAYYNPSSWFFILLCSLLAISRACHSIGLLKFETIIVDGKPTPNLLPRMFGMIGTFLVMILSISYLVCVIVF